MASSALHVTEDVLDTQTSIWFPTVSLSDLLGRTIRKLEQVGNKVIGMTTCLSPEFTVAVNGVDFAFGSINGDALLNRDFSLACSTYSAEACGAVVEGLLGTVVPPRA